MEVIGKIIQAFDAVEGVSKAGNPWKKREYVLETLETYPKKVFFNFFGDRVDQYPLAVGQTVKLSFDIDSREFNNRWYVDIRGWKSEPYDPSQAATSAAPAATVAPMSQMPQGYSTPGAPVPPPPADLAPSATDDLPF